MSPSKCSHYAAYLRQKCSHIIFFFQIARDQARDESAGKSQVIERLEGEVADHLKTIAECKERTREDEMVRRRLHNTIQELKGEHRTVKLRVRFFYT